MSNETIVPNADPAGLNQCEDFIQFENALRQSRAIDDKIINALNNSIPTESFKGQINATEKCKELWNSIESTYNRRESALSKCLVQSEARVKTLREAGDRAAMRQAQVMLRMLQSELTVEEVIRNRTQTAFHEKCRDFYKPNTSS